jgi:prohibitin 2
VVHQNGLTWIGVRFCVQAQFNASQLITQRELVSRLVRKRLVERAKDFNIFLDDVAITHLNFGREYTAAVEAKQVAQQDAERAKFIVEKAQQDKLSAIIRATGEAKSAELVRSAFWFFFLAFCRRSLVPIRGVLT